MWPEPANPRGAATRAGALAYAGVADPLRAGPRFVLPEGGVTAAGARPSSLGQLSRAPV